MSGSPRDIRPFVYAGIDLAFAAVYVWISRTLIPTSNGVFEWISLGFAAAAVAMSAGTLIPRPWGWWTATLGCVALLVGATAVLVLLAMSAAFLAGVFGSFGKGAAAMTLVAGALAVELYFLLPAFQLRYLLSPAARRRSGR